MSQFRRIIAGVAAVLMTLSVIPTVSAGSVFNDVDDFSEFASYIHQLAGDGIVSGLNGNYYPLLNVTRAEMTKFVQGAAGLATQIAPGEPHFTDVPMTHTLFNSVETLYANGVVQGRAPGKFMPDDPVLRQEAIKIVMGAMRAVDTNGYFAPNTIGAPHFSDVSAGSEFYSDIETAYNLGIINGYGNGKFGPMDPTRRDQMAKIIANAMNVLRNGPPLVPVGAPAKLRLETDADALYPDGASSAQITATIVDSQGNIVGGWAGPVNCTTDLGTITKITGSKGSDSLVVTADSGRAQFSLYTGKEEGTATVSCQAASLPKGVVQIEFSKDAPRARNGFGQNTVSGTGSIQIIITDDVLLTQRYTDAFPTDFLHVVGGCALVEVYTFDDEGDPMNAETIQLTITEGNAHLTTGLCPATVSSGTRSVELTTDDNGRAIAYLNALTTQQEGDVELTAIDKDSNPTLTVDAVATFNNITLQADVFPDKSITTRNNTQITGNDALVINEALIWLLVEDENGDPITDGASHDITARFTGGVTSGARFVGCATIGCATPTSVATEVKMWEVRDSGGTKIPGLYSVKVLAGDAEGTLEVELRDKTAVGEPSTQVSVSVAEPELECFTSGEEVGQDLNASIVCRLTTADGVPITGESLQCKIQGGDGALDLTPGDQDPSATSVTMEAVDDQLSGDTGFGWYWCDYESRTSIPRDNPITLRITDLDRTSLPSDTVTVTETNDNPGNPTQLTLEPLRTNLPPSTETSVLAIVQDADEFGIPSMAVTGTTGSPGLVRINMSTMINMNISNGMEELGGGAYFFNPSSKNVDDNGTVEVEMYNSGGVFVEDQEAQFNIIDDSVTDVATRDSMLVDEGFGIVMCVADVAGDPVAGLVAGDWTVTNLGVATTRSTPTEIQPASDVTGVAGSGCYNISVDTAGTVQPNDEVEIRTALTGRPTNPQDTVTVAIDDVELELMAHPDFTQSGNCTTITAIIRDAEGDPVDVLDPATNGVELEITSGSGGLKTGDVTAANCDMSGSATNITMIDNVGTTAVANGVFIATFISDVISGTAEITGRVQGANSRAEDSISINVD